MDPLSEVLEGVRLRCIVHSHNEFRAPWGFGHSGRFPIVSDGDGAGSNGAAVPGLHGTFFLITQGECLLEVEGVGEAVRLSEGDFVVLPHGCAHRMRDQLDSPVRPLAEILQRANARERGGVSYGGGGALTTFIVGLLFFEERQHDRLLSALPPVIHIRAGSERSVAWLEQVSRILTSETAAYEPGAQSIINHLAQVLFIQAVRHHVATLAPGEGDWLRALFDEEIGVVLGHIHRRPEATWTVGSLADGVAMSRSAFAARFTELVGEPPLRYLTRYRMRRAAQYLREGRAALREIAARVGYESEAAFSHAFKRQYGVAPGAFRGRGKRVHVRNDEPRLAEPNKV